MQTHAWELDVEVSNLGRGDSQQGASSVWSKHVRWQVVASGGGSGPLAIKILRQLSLFHRVSMVNVSQLGFMDMGNSMLELHAYCVFREPYKLSIMVE